MWETSSLWHDSPSLQPFAVRASFKLWAEREAAAGENAEGELEKHTAGLEPSTLSVAAGAAMTKRTGILPFAVFHLNHLKPQPHR